MHVHMVMIQIAKELSQPMPLVYLIRTTTGKSTFSRDLTIRYRSAQFGPFTLPGCSVASSPYSAVTTTPSQTFISTAANTVVIGGGGSVTQVSGTADVLSLTHWYPSGSVAWNKFAISARARTSETGKVKAYGIVCPNTVACFPELTTTVPKMVLRRFEQKTAQPASTYSWVNLILPAGYKVIAGGASVDSTCPDLHITHSYPGATTSIDGTRLSTWFARASRYPSQSSTCTGQVTAYAIGLFDPNDEWGIYQLNRYGSYSTNPTITATLPSYYALTGGGFYTYDQIGLTKS